MIEGIAQTVFDFSTNDSIGVGFKDYDDLIFNKNNDELYPFTDELWSKTMKWYKIFSIVSESLTSRIAGMDNEEMTGRVMTMGEMAGYGIASIKERFKTQKVSDNNSTEDSKFENSFVSKVKNIINPTKNISNVENYDEIEEDYMPKRKSLGSIAGKIALTGIKATGE